MKKASFSMTLNAYAKQIDNADRGRDGGNPSGFFAQTEFATNLPPTIKREARRLSASEGADGLPSEIEGHRGCASRCTIAMIAFICGLDLYA
jgi:hypothetical protein